MVHLEVYYLLSLKTHHKKKLLLNGKNISDELSFYLLPHIYLYLEWKRNIVRKISIEFHIKSIFLDSWQECMDLREIKVWIEFGS
jgi:hypothetical protein